VSPTCSSLPAIIAPALHFIYKFINVTLLLKNEPRWKKTTSGIFI
jgi:hypothetical protein